MHALWRPGGSIGGLRNCYLSSELDHISLHLRVGLVQLLDLLVQLLDFLIILYACRDGRVRDVGRGPPWGGRGVRDAGPRATMGRTGGSETWAGGCCGEDGRVRDVGRGPPWGGRGLEMLGPGPLRGGRGVRDAGPGATMGRTGGSETWAPGRHGEDWGTVTPPDGEPSLLGKQTLE